MKRKNYKEEYDPCKQCKPHWLTGNRPCDNGYMCEHLPIYSEDKDEK